MNVDTLIPLNIAYSDGRRSIVFARQSTIVEVINDPGIIVVKLRNEKGTVVPWLMAGKQFEYIQRQEGSDIAKLRSFLQGVVNQGDALELIELDDQE